MLSTRDALEQYSVQGQNFSTDQRWGRQASAVSATGGYTGEPGTYKCITMSAPGDNTDAVLNCQRVIGEDAARSVEVTVVVRGWFADSGNL